MFVVLRRGLLAAWLAVAAGCAVTDVVAEASDACPEGRCQAQDAATCHIETFATGDTRCGGEGFLHRHALCVCEDYVSAHALRVDGQGEHAGSVGINGDLDTGGAVEVGGLLQVAGEGGISASGAGALEVGELRSGAGISGTSLTVSGDAEVAGDVRVSTLRVAGTLRQPEGATRSVTETSEIGASETGAVDVALPCACEAPRPDVQAAVRERRNDNDNTRAGLSAFALDGFDTATSLELRCGHYHLSRIAGSGMLELEIQGDVALYVDGDVAIEGSFHVELAEGASLWLIVEDHFRVTESLRLGAPTDSGRVALRVGGSGTLQLGQSAVLKGTLYAPDAELVTQDALEVYGALLVRRAAPGGTLALTYDVAQTTCRMAL